MALVMGVDSSTQSCKVVIVPASRDDRAVKLDSVFLRITIV